MNHEYRKDRSQLVILVDAEERDALKDLKRYEGDDWGTTRAECEFLEPLTCNSELQWIDPADTGDLTAAPLLGITGDEWSRSAVGPYGSIHIGGDECGPWFVPILERWGFMHYALRSILDDLLDGGEAVFVNKH